MSFETINKLSMLVGDEIAAFNIANEFVKDDANKFIVFERAFNQTPGQPQPQAQQGQMAARASIAKDKAGQVWANAYEAKPE